MKRKGLVVSYFAVTWALLSSVCTQAASPPDAGSLIRDITRPGQQERPSGTLPPITLSGEEKGQDSGVRVLVRGFRISRATLLPESELQALLVDFVGKELSLGQLQQAALRISEHYRRRGYFARALLPKQVVRDGVVEIIVLESSMGEISVTEPHPQRAKPEVARQMVLSQQKIGEPLRPDDVLAGLKLINETPGYSATAMLQPGDKETETRLLVTLEDTPLFSGLAMLDNQGLKATGVARLLGVANLNNPSGYGDQLNLMGLASEGNGFARGAYTFRLGYRGLRLGLNATGLRYKLIGAMSDLNAKGDAQLFGANLTYPLLRRSTLNLQVGAAVDTKRFVNSINGIDTSNKVLNTFSGGINGDFLDGWMGGGFSQFSLSAAAGRVDLTNNSDDFNFDQLTAGTHGEYWKLGASLARLQKITDRTGLFVGFSGQFAGDNLDSSEKFSLGGPNGIRGYPLGEGAGDSGWLLVSEFRYSLLETLQILGFVDTGWIVQHKNPWNGWNEGRLDLPNSYSLSGGGVGLNWAPGKDFMLRAMVAGPLGRNPGRDANGNDSDGATHRARVWLQMSKSF